MFNNGIYFGEVIDINDPELIGRVKVRCYVIHPDTIDDAALPWALVMQPTSSAGWNGVGYSGIGLEVHSQVALISLDGDDMQQLMVIGTVPARGDFTSLINTRQSQGKLLKFEPQNKASPKYPFNRVHKTMSGHTIELDDTPQHERLKVTHKTGSYIEINEDGSVILKSIKDDYKISNENSFSYNSKNNQIYIGGDAKVWVNGDSVTNTKGLTTINSGKGLHIFSPSIVITEKSTPLENILGNESNLLSKEGIIGVLDDVIPNGGTINLDASNQYPLFKLALDTSQSLEKFSLNNISADLNNSLSNLDKLTTIANSDEILNIPKVIKNNANSLSFLSTVKSSINQLANGIKQGLADIESLKANTFSTISTYQNSIKDQINAALNLDEKNDLSQFLSKFNELSNGINSLTAITNDITSSISFPDFKIPMMDISINSLKDATNEIYDTILYGNIKLSDLTTNTELSSNLIEHIDPSSVIHNLSKIAFIVNEINNKFPNVKVMSGYKNGYDLNDSDHFDGRAVDLYWDNMTEYDHFNITKWIGENLSFKNLIFSHGETPWIHISIDDENKKELLTMVNGTYQQDLNFYYNTEA